MNSRAPLSRSVRGTRSISVIQSSSKATALAADLLK